MIPTNSYLTHTRFGIDKNVLSTMLILSIVAVGLLAFKLASKKPCMPFSISTASVTNGNSVDFYTGDPVIFNASSNNEEDISWDFGDHTPTANGNNTKHVYVRDGNFVVNATINGQCVQVLTLHIKPLQTGGKEDAVETMAINPITGQDAPTAGVLASFSSSVKAAKYEWNILNSPIFTTQNGDIATYNFPIPGEQIIELKLDGDPTKVFRKQITVLPGKQLPTNNMPTNAQGGGGGGQAPPPVIPIIIPTPSKKDDPIIEKPVTPTPVEKPKKLLVPDDVLRMKFEAVVRGEVDATTFDECLCDEKDTKILVENDNNRWETVGSLCKLFFRNKKIKDIETKSERDPKTNCVTLIRIKYKKKGGLF